MAEAKQKMVTVRIPKDKNNTGDVFVCVNARTYLIQRGKDVQVPDFVAEVLRHKQEMEDTVLERMEAAKKK